MTWLSSAYLGDMMHCILSVRSLFFGAYDNSLMLQMTVILLVHPVGF